MRCRQCILAATVALTQLFCFSQARAQAPAQANASRGPAVVKTINVTGRPIPEALDVIEKRYGVLIDYADPVYASTEDTQLLRFLKGKPLNAPILIPKLWTLSVQYDEVKETPAGIPYLSCKVQSATCNPVSVWPSHGITALIRKVLTAFAAEGGSIFGVRKLNTRFGPRWEVYPVKARNAVGTFVAQRDFLGAQVRIPPAKRTGVDMLELVAQQLTRKWRRRFLVASTRAWGNDVGLPLPKSELGAEGVTARQAILDLLGWTTTIRVYYDPEDESYAINLAGMPYRQPPRPSPPPAIPARVLPPRPLYPSDWVRLSHSPRGTAEIQGALAKAGYLQTAPVRKWDARAVDALRHFQAANGLRATGSFDIWTAEKLLPFLPELPARIEPAKPAMDPALAYWLGSTPDGRKEMEEALAKAGFYHGAVTGLSNNPGAEAALKAFQVANGLHPNGYLDYATAEKLAPFLPKQTE